MKCRKVLCKELGNRVQTFPPRTGLELFSTSCLQPPSFGLNLACYPMSKDHFRLWLLKHPVPLKVMQH